jgi:hypothetical protein
MRKDGFCDAEYQIGGFLTIGGVAGNLTTGVAMAQWPEVFGLPR